MSSTPEARSLTPSHSSQPMCTGARANPNGVMSARLGREILRLSLSLPRTILEAKDLWRRSSSVGLMPLYGNSDSLTKCHLVPFF